MNYTRLFLEAVQTNDIDTVKRLIRQEIDLNPPLDISPLAEAARSGRLEIIKLLMKGGANINHQMEEDGENETALMWAARHGQLEAVKLLVEKGADVNIKNSYQETALSIAASNAHENIFNYLNSLTTPNWEPGSKVLADAKRKRRIRNVKGVWIDPREESVAKH